MTITRRALMACATGVFAGSVLCAAVPANAATAQSPNAPAASAGGQELVTKIKSDPRDGHHHHHDCDFGGFRDDCHGHKHRGRDCDYRGHRCDDETEYFKYNKDYIEHREYHVDFEYFKDRDNHRKRHGDDCKRYRQRVSS